MPSVQPLSSCRQHPVHAILYKYWRLSGCDPNPTPDWPAALTSYGYITQLSYFENCRGRNESFPLHGQLPPSWYRKKNRRRLIEPILLSASCVFPNLKGRYSPRNNNVNFDCAQDQYAATGFDLSYYLADIANAPWARFTEHGHPRRYATLRNLAAALWTRQKATGDGQGKGNAEELDLTIIHLASALATSPPDRASLLDDLSAALQTRYAR
ncbi:hypothetical protein BV22DRAFT_346037 [Leucogyrophana mollusca]|uniref:Uncharacterized protein n=1 Tax=Leucogyrophana mollusca TaxID=85980 RepID=A0ACB8BPK3_9AGAM|nr:hypothetical protein BV22DRAFT_346037 [Leucogyrophana mollusca]